MKTSTKFIIAAIILIAIPHPITWIIGTLCAIAGIGLIIYNEITKKNSKQEP